MVQNMTMKKVNIFEAKARLSECIDAAQHGERILTPDPLISQYPARVIW